MVASGSSAAALLPEQQHICPTLGSSCGMALLCGSVTLLWQSQLLPFVAEQGRRLARMRRHHGSIIDVLSSHRVPGDRVSYSSDTAKLQAASCIPQVDKGADIFISVWNLHRSPEYWDRPNEFDPTRFDLSRSVPNEQTHNFAYLPFGGGRRKCIGAQHL